MRERFKDDTLISLKIDIDYDFQMTLVVTDRHGEQFNLEGSAAWKQLWKMFPTDAGEPKYSGTLDEIRDEYMYMLFAEGYSQRVVAGRLGVTEGSVQRWQQASRKRTSLKHGTYEDTALRRYEKSCVACGEPFRADAPNTKWCSTACKIKSKDIVRAA